MADYHSEDAWTNFGPTPDTSFVEYWSTSLAVQQRMDQKGDGDVCPHHNASGGSSAAGLVPHCQVVPLADLPRLRYLDGGRSRVEGPTQR